MAVTIDGSANTITAEATSATTATSLTTASGSAPSYSARAWVNFNGTGTVAIRASGNVSSITDNGTGLYTINFTTAMPDANYSSCMNLQRSGTTNSAIYNCIASGNANSKYDVNGIAVWTATLAGTATDTELVAVSIFR